MDAGFLIGVAHIRAEQTEFGFPNTKRLGRATVQLRDSQLQIVVNYEYSQRNHDSTRLLVDLGARSEKRPVLDIQSLRRNASVWRRDLGSYFGALLDKDRNTFDELYLEMPRGTWDSGEYAMLIEHPHARLKLPISLN